MKKTFLHHALWLAIGHLILSCGPAGTTRNVPSEPTATTETKRDTLTDGLGDMQQHTYRGLLPAASGPGIEYTLTVSHRLHSGDGTFTLILTYKEADNGQDRSFTYRGKRLTLRGIPGNDDATVWQCIADDGQETFNFLKEDETTLTLLNSDFEKPRTQLNYSLRLVE